MKNFYLLTLVFLPLFTVAQITLTADDIPQAGEALVSIDCEIPPGFSIGSPGPNQTYDFSMLVPIDTTFTDFISPIGTPGQTEFANATLATTDDGGEGYFYYQQTNDALLLLGFYVDTSENSSGQFVTSRFTPANKIFEIPSTYNTSFQSISSTSFTFADDSGMFDSLRTTITFDNNVLFDGYGTVITPNGSFEGLREKQINMTTSSSEIYFLGMWSPFFSSTFIDTAYNWYGHNDIGLASASISNGAVESVSYSAQGVVGMTPQATFTPNDTGGGTVEFTDGSTNSPTSWLWDFGDGNTSMMQNPQHTYAATGNYNVCLTVSNSSGSNTTCMMVNIILSSTEDFAASLRVTISPNPATKYLNILLEGASSNSLHLQVVNSLGQRIQELELQTNGTYVVDLQHLPASVYYYYLINQQGKLFQSGSFIKNDF